MQRGVVGMYDAECFLIIIIIVILLGVIPFPYYQCSLLFSCVFAIECCVHWYLDSDAYETDYWGV